MRVMYESNNMIVRIPETKNVVLLKWWKYGSKFAYQIGFLQNADKILVLWLEQRKTSFDYTSILLNIWEITLV